MQHAATPQLTDAGYVGQLVDEPGGEDQPPDAQRLACVQPQVEPVTGPGHREHRVIADLDAVRLGLLTPGREQLQRRYALPAQHVVGAGGVSVARASGVDQHDGAQRPGEGDRCAQTGGTGADDGDVMGEGGYGYGSVGHGAPCSWSAGTAPG